MMADEIFYESKMLKRSWTWQEWKRDWDQIQHLQHTDPSGFVFNVHDCCCNPKAIVYSNLCRGEYVFSLVVFCYQEEWYYSTFAATSNSGGSGPSTRPFRNEGQPSEKQVVIEAFNKLLETYTEPGYQKIINEKFAEWKSQNTEPIQLSLF